MKRKSVLRMGVALLTVSFLMGSADGKKGQIALAEEELVIDDNEDDEVLENTERQDTTVVPDSGSYAETGADTTDASDFLDEIEIEEETEVVAEEQTEVLLPERSVLMPVADLWPVKEEEEPVVVHPCDGLYLLHLKNDNVSGTDLEEAYTLSFNQSLKEADVVLYQFDSEKNRVDDPEPVEDIISFHEDDSEISLDLEADADYILVIAQEEIETELEMELTYTSKVTVVQIAETEETEPESETITEPESELVTEAESEETTESESEAVTEPESEENTEPESEKITEAESEEITEPETEALVEQESETETEEEAVLVSVVLNVDQDLELVPVAFLEYLDDLDVYSVTLVYSDGSEKLLDKTDERYTLTADYEDVKDSEETVHRTYHISLEEHSTGKQFEDTQGIEIGGKDPVEIKTEEMTTVLLGGKKKWAVVQSVPGVTGRYAMNSDKMIEMIYYVSDNGEVVSTEDVLTLKEGVTYRFLIKLR